MLIGAGPGDPELMTLKAARLLGEADLVLVDDLVGRGCLAHARPGAQVIAVGKRGFCRRTPQALIHATPQAFIERLMIREAKAGRTVARLKGGDPFVFGRGGEELERLLAAGVEVEVVPGITAGISVPASLGIPVTHRALAHGVTFVTGHTSDGREPDWRLLARSRTTLVIYMGLGKMKGILPQLEAGGLDRATPACIIENGTLPAQRQRFATLGTLSGEGFSGPALVVVGEVVRLAALSWHWPKAWAA